MALLASMTAVSLVFAWRWFNAVRQSRHRGEPLQPGVSRTVLGFVTNFFDTLGIGSFASTGAFYKLRRMMPDELIPGTLNVGHALPTLVQALIFVGAVAVGSVTLISMIAAALLGAWLGAGVVSRMPRHAIQIGMGVALSVAAVTLVLVNFELLPGGGDALQLSGGKLVLAIGVNFVLGALMTLGVGLYAPCLILVSLLGMNPIAAFPLMMGSCAFLMPVAGMRFVRTGRYDLRAAIGLAIGGIPAVLIAGFLVRSLPLGWLRWLVVVVVLYAAIAMLRSAFGRAPSSAVANSVQ